jgi:hypothetical protein
LAAAPVPIEPPAPDRFSTTNCCLSGPESFAPTRRASGSTVPPGGKGTMNFTGFAGQSCAAAGSAWARTSANRLMAMRITAYPPLACRERAAAGLSGFASSAALRFTGNGVLASGGGIMGAG